jgi:hypothetical protein
MTDNPNTPNERRPPPRGGRAPGGGFDADAVKAAFLRADRADLVIIGAGVLAFLFSLFPYYTASVGALGGSETAWHGFWGWFAALAALAGSVVLALPLLGVRAALPSRLVVLGCYVVATLCVLIAGFTWPGKGDACGGNNLCKKVFDSATGHGFGYWASLIVIVVGLVYAAFRYVDKPIPRMPR